MRDEQPEYHTKRLTLINGGSELKARGFAAIKEIASPSMDGKKVDEMIERMKPRGQLRETGNGRPHRD